VIIEVDRCAIEGLLSAGGPADVTRLEYPQMPHAFYYVLGLADDVDRVHHAMGAFLRRTLTEAATASGR
jgi:hypothetical protein